MTSTVDSSVDRTDATRAEAWHGFTGSRWRGSIDVAAFIVDNVTPYAGGRSFLAPATERTSRL